ncbi:DUF3519 domain-containing protein [Helicobacter cetorum]|uniref:putative barnase/colicin E5 family endoribonuclease n=1 Tax=Helicobacter cetorum TaxID=138563 RepID=UPI000CF189F1|nr:DUF3519 domain-containing protein [Helicobacter cetorum]
MQLIEEINSGVKLASEEVRESVKNYERFGTNYSEFKGDGLGAINKLLETKEGYVEGAFHKQGLGDIDLVYGNSKYGLEHILKRRISDAIDKGLSESKAKEYAIDIARNIPNVINNGSIVKDDLGRLSVEFKNQKVGLKDNWQGEPLKNKWIITSYEIDKSRNGLIESPLAPNYKGKDTTPLNLNEPNSTTNLSPLELANLEKQQKLLKEQELKELEREQLQESIQQHKLERQAIRDAKNSTLGKSELDREIAKNSEIPFYEIENAPKITKEKETSYNEIFENKKKDENMPKLSFSEIKELIDKSPRYGDSMEIIGNNNITPEVVEYIDKNNKRVAIEKIEPSIAKELGLKHIDNARAVIDYSAIKHTLKRHGVNSPNARLSKQPPITYDDIANYRKIANGADEVIKTRGNNNELRILSFKQENGYYVIVEQVSKKHNEINLVTMFKEKGNYKNGNTYIKATKNSN